MAQHEKKNGSITVKGADGKITGNISGGALTGPSNTNGVAIVASPSAPNTNPEALRVLAVSTDTSLADLYNRSWYVRATLGTHFDHLHYCLDDCRDWNGKWGMTPERVEAEARERAATGDVWRVKDLVNTLNSIDAGRAELDAIEKQMTPLEAEYRKHLWTRAFLVTGTGTGHVHKSMSCSTCYDTTKFSWLPEYSGADEAEVIESAGERACSICFPGVSAEILSRPTRIFSQEEKEQSIARTERAEAKKARDLAKIEKAATPDGSELVVVTERGINPEYSRNPGQPFERVERFKTERAAMIWAVDTITWGRYRVTNNPDKYGNDGMTDVEREAITTICASLAAKHGVSEDEIRGQIAKKVAAKTKRDR